MCPAALVERAAAVHADVLRSADTHQGARAAQVVSPGSVAVVVAEVEVLRKVRATSLVERAIAVHANKLSAVSGRQDAAGQTGHSGRSGTVGEQQVSSEFVGS